MKGIKIASDGTPAGTKVTTSSGAEVDGITSIKWGIEVDGLAHAEVGFILAAADLKVPEDEIDYAHWLYEAERMTELDVMLAKQALREGFNRIERKYIPQKSPLQKSIESLQAFGRALRNCGYAIP